jgi:GNAT superfamily N-acetyltransferase
MDVVIRRALPADAPALTRLARAAKRHWGYPGEWLLLWRQALTVTPEFVRAHPVACATRGAALLGFYALSGAGAQRELEHFWVAPAQIGRGVGARLFAHAVRSLRADGARMLRIAADPHAVGFYLRVRARRAGEWPSTPRGRTLPLLVYRI